MAQFILALKGQVFLRPLDKKARSVQDVAKKQAPLSQKAETTSQSQNQPQRPTDSPEEIKQKKEKAQAHNQQNPYLKIVNDVHKVILSEVPQKDHKNIALTCTHLNKQVNNYNADRTSKAIGTISQIIEFAALFDSEIKRITKESLMGTTDTSPGAYHHFKFDPEKWTRMIESIKQKAVAPQRAAELEQNCYLDLVEALAEYNVDEKCHDNRTRRPIINPDRLINPDRPISQIDISKIVKDLKPEQAKMMTQILDEAKGTLKGDLFLWGYASSEKEPDQIMLRAFEKDANGRVAEGRVMINGGIDLIKGLYVNGWLTNRENDHWKNHYYDRHIGGEAIHIDWLIGKREGSRIVIPKAKEGTGDRQIILRCRQLQYRYNYMPFEKLLALHLLRLVTQSDFDFPDLRRAPQSRDEVIAKLKNAYGEELLTAVMKDIQKR